MTHKADSHLLFHVVLNTFFSNLPLTGSLTDGLLPLRSKGCGFDTRSVHVLIR